MENAWDDGEISKQASELDRCVYASHLIGKEKMLALTRSCSASVKVSTKDLFGGLEDILWISAEGQVLSTITTERFTPLHNASVNALASLEGLAEEQFKNALYCSRAQADAPLPPLEAAAHAVLPGRYVFFIYPEALQVIVSTAGWKERLQQIYAEALLVIEGGPEGASLAKAISSSFSAAGSNRIEGILAPGSGLFTFGNDAEEVYARTIRLVSRAEEHLRQAQAWDLKFAPAPIPERPLRGELAALRKTISDLAGYPVLLCASQSSSSFASFPGEGSPEIFRLGDEKPTAVPVVILGSDLGMLTVGRTAEGARWVEDAYLQAARVKARSLALGEYQPYSEGDFLGKRDAWRVQPLEKTGEKSSMFSGEVALVTGGASGIGKACVESLLARGAAVASMDINPRVKTLYNRADYLGLELDLTDEAAVIQGFESAARTFGGLDMVVLNAGIFPAGIRIESLDMASWHRVLRINLDSYLVVMREAYPLLKASPRGGRLVLNASKNVLAPGAGAAAYSSSKAAVTQLARVAALEWGKDHIRVNIVHPDSIYDTGIWTEEVLKARAAFYGVTVQQYKTRNVLGVELNSHYVGELVAEMLGPLFEKITGAQLPVDGGSDRVI